MINVLYLSHEGSDIGGSTKSLVNMINSLKGHVKPIVIVPSQGDASDYVSKHGIELHIIPFNLSFTDKTGISRVITFLPRVVRDYMANSKAKKQIRKIIATRNINIVHSNSASIDFGRGLAREIGAKHVWHLREFLSCDFNFNPVVGWNTFRRKISQSDAIVSISDSIQRHYKLHDTRRASVIYNAIISSKEVPPITQKDPYILFTGKIGPAKGIDEALTAFMSLADKHELNMIVAGKVEQDYLSSLSQKVQSYMQAGRIKFIGFSNKVDELMAKAQCLLMCSKNEALGRVTVEAMYNGCIVVGYDNAGTSEIIEHGINGFLYKDTYELISHIEYVISHGMEPILRRAQDYAVANFSETTFSLKMLNVYRSLR